MKTLIERIKSNISKLDFNNNLDRALAVYDLRLLIYFITNDILVYDKGRNFNKTLTKIMKIYEDLTLSQKCKTYNQDHKEFVKILDKLIIKVS